MTAEFWRHMIPKFSGGHAYNFPPINAVKQTLITQNFMLSETSIQNRSTNLGRL